MFRHLSRQNTRISLTLEKLETKYCLAAVFPLPHIMSGDATGVQAVHAADADGDGDLDVFAASETGGITWYDNTDGRGSFTLRRINETVDGARSIHAGDVDGDGDLDILSASYGDDTIAWYENHDAMDTNHNGVIDSQDLTLIFAAGKYESGQSANHHEGDWNGDGFFDSSDFVLAFDDRIPPAFGQHVITTDAHGAQAVYAADLNNDGHLDVLSASSTDNKIAWYKNSNGQGTFGPQQVITIEAHGAMAVHAADLDSDGDIDVLSASSDDDKVSWYENTDGMGTFGPQQVITIEARGAQAVYTADVDDDGDIDVLSASADDSTIAWYENTDGRGVFGSPRLVATQVNGAATVLATDLDSDGDDDVLLGSPYYGSLPWGLSRQAWNANLGTSPYFCQDTHATNGATSISTGDFDGDGDIDIVSASNDEGYIVWYENRSPGDVDDNGQFDSSDLVFVFRAGQYEDNISGNSTWSEGDWDGDGDFTSSDFVWLFHALGGPHGFGCGGP